MRRALGRADTQHVDVQANMDAKKIFSIAWHCCVRSTSRSAAAGKPAMRLDYCCGSRNLPGRSIEDPVMRASARVRANVPRPPGAAPSRRR